ncbi:hypothetical protein ACGFIF_43935 [Kribbella sp. NPDC049174]|uniref:hypothetical protein n=1 Tax=Kribbella sp. NPDC049174 TaxID=3364112 RepID=UPI00371D535A
MAFALLSQVHDLFTGAGVAAYHFASLIGRMLAAVRTGGAVTKSAGYSSFIVSPVLVGWVAGHPQDRACRRGRDGSRHRRTGCPLARSTAALKDSDQHALADGQ